MADAVGDDTALHHRFGDVPSDVAAGEGGEEVSKEKTFTEAERHHISETVKHIQEVQSLLRRFSVELLERGEDHDRSKLSAPELETFAEYTPKLKNCTYGSEEYKTYLKEMEPALKHHYENNRHHPEFHQDDIRGMTLFDLTEMLCDWIAATKRHADGDIFRSIEINQHRFGYDDEVYRLLTNTVNALIEMGVVEYHD